METNTPLIFDIQRGSYVDGPGIRTVIFCKGCNLDCAWCHNPESKSPLKQLLYYRARCTRCGACHAVCGQGAVREDMTVDGTKCVCCGECADVCPANAKMICGNPMRIEEIVKTAVKDKGYYEATGGGVTISGGECMLYPDFVFELAARLKSEGIAAAVDTAGNVPRSSFEKVLPHTALFLYDLKHTDAKRHKDGTGADNGRILANLEWLYAQAPEKILLRIPLIPGFNTDEESLAGLRDWLLAHKNIQRVEPLQYHKLGDSKAEALGRGKYEAAVPSKAEFERMKTILLG